MTSDDDTVSFTMSGLEEKDQTKVKDILGGIVEGHVDIGRICRKMSGEGYIMYNNMFRSQRIHCIIINLLVCCFLRYLELLWENLLK